MKKIIFALIFILVLTPQPKVQKVKADPNTQIVSLSQTPAVSHIVTPETIIKPKCKIAKELYKKQLKLKKLKAKRKARKKAKRIAKRKLRREQQLEAQKNQIYLLAKLIYCEVGNVSDDRCLELCGSVVLNRIKDSRYPNTLEGVIFQKGQYEVTWNGHWNYKEPDTRCLKIAKRLIQHGSVQKDVNAMSERVWGRYYCSFGNVVFSIC
ncbi:MAG: cell wall hydrolase [Lachnospiraceae bacterium]|nr:cell wall hydrolase [Lachnospiraceae bacterium]